MVHPGPDLLRSRASGGWAHNVVAITIAAVLALVAVKAARGQAGTTDGPPAGHEEQSQRLAPRAPPAGPGADPVQGGEAPGAPVRRPPTASR